MLPREKWAVAIKDFHERGIPELVERESAIPKEIPLKRAISIIGPRRAGKTYTMFQLIKGLLEEGVDVSRIVYINFERTELEGASSRELVGMMEAFYELYPQNKVKKTWLFLDEIQNVEKWETFVRTVLDSGNVQVFISGSSSKLLSREIATSMRGRTISHLVLPFSFIDYLKKEGTGIQKIKAEAYLSTSERANVINKLRSYMESGGYPEVIIYPQEKEKILQDIVETTVYRDVVERYKIRNTRLLKLLIKSLVNSVAREFSIHKFYNFVRSMGIKASKNSLYNYADALNDVFFVFPINKFSRSYKKAEQSLPKIYLVDNGILTSNGINDYGRLLENLVFVELTRRGKNISYYKSADGKEVDFAILEKNRVKELIQVAYSLEDFNTREREIKPLLKASKELKCNNLTIITWSEDKEEVAKGKKIIQVPLWKWLLEKS
jgi:hypothetical protein